MTNVIELVSFKLKKEINQSDFLNTSNAFGKEFVALEKGFISRKLAKENDIWADLVIWDTKEDAMAINEAMAVNEFAGKYMNCIDETSISMQHFSVIASN